MDYNRAFLQIVNEPDMQQLNANMHHFAYRIMESIKENGDVDWFDISLEENSLYGFATDTQVISAWAMSHASFVHINEQWRQYMIEMVGARELTDLESVIQDVLNVMEQAFAEHLDRRHEDE